jgi:MoaA/NifB/PqqE/SkfB family radical SAM enzyme
MEESTIDLFVSYARFVSERYKPDQFCVTFLGGEPMLYPEIVFSTVKKLQGIKPEIKFFMFTNGSLLTEDLAEKLSSCNVKIFLSSNETALEKIIEMGELINRYQKQLRVAIAVSESILSKVVTLTETVLTKGWLPRYLLTGTQIVKRFSDQNLVISEMSKCFYLMRDYGVTGEKCRWLFDSMDPAAKSEKSVYLIGKYFLVFDHDGLVRPLPPRRDTAIHLGRLGDGIDYLEVLRTFPNKELIPRWTARGIDRCQQCSLLSVCQGGQPGGRPKQFEPTVLCELLKSLIPLYQKLYRGEL